MTAETSNARGDVVAERQAWYEQQIALAEGQWAAAFLDRWECGDDVPSKEHYVALWLAERAAPPPADARGDVRGLVALAEQMERDAAGCRRDGYIDAAVVKEDCAQRIRQTLGISAIAEVLAARGDVRGLVDALVDAAYQDGTQELDEMSADTLRARDAVVQALAQHPAIGEEIMVNAAHDVYTLPLQPSGLSSGPRFVVHVPAPEQQPAAVDEAMVERALRAWREAVVVHEGNKPAIRAALTAALTAQPGGSDNDR